MTTNALCTTGSHQDKKEKAVVVCLLCKRYLCRTCDQTAHSQPNTKAHHRFPITSLQSHINFDSQQNDESPIYRNLLTPNGVKEPSHNGCRTVYELFQRSLKLYAASPFLGMRTVDSKGNPGPYVFSTYHEIGVRVTNFASGLRYFGIQPGDRIGLYSINRTEWLLSDYACHNQNLVSVPLYDTFGPDAAEYVMKQSTCTAVICSADKLAGIHTYYKNLPDLRIIVVMPLTPFDAAPKFPFDGKMIELENGTKIVSFTEVEAKGKANIVAPVPPKPTDMYTLCYTSGTTGVPKGAVLNHANIVANCEAIHRAGISSGPGDLHISYLPLAHMMERVTSSINMSGGSCIGFSRGNPLTLLEDIAALRPTIFVGVPRLYNRLYDRISSTVKQSGSIRKWLFSYAYQTKKNNAINNGGLTHALWDRIVFQKIAASLGGRVRLFITGSAPISNNVIEFLRICFSAQVVEGYGQTEGTAATSITNIHDVACVGNVGSPIICNEIKLVDVPEMDYKSTDIVNGIPCPRGEIWVKGTNVFQGYYKDEKNTSETLSNGWLRTGDIGMILPNGTLKIIDRKKNIFKLSQGEYIAPEKIENTYIRNRFIAQMFVYGDSLQSSLVGIVVPDEEQVRAWAKLNKIDASDYKALLSNPAVKAFILQEMQTTANKAQLRGFEQVNHIHLHHELFSVENGILTPTMKLKRTEAKKKFQPQIDALYIQLSEDEKEKTKVKSKL